MGSQVEVCLVMNQLMYCNQSKNPFISFSLLGGGISNMALIFNGSTSIPLSVTKKPNNFPMVTLNVHFCGLNLSLYSLIHSLLGFHNHINNIHFNHIVHHIT